jgi:hypothetical protein
MRTPRKNTVSQPVSTAFTCFHITLDLRHASSQVATPWAPISQRRFSSGLLLKQGLFKRIAKLETMVWNVLAIECRDFLWVSLRPLQRYDS